MLMQGHRFNRWSRKISRTTRQLSWCVTATEPCPLQPVLCNRRSPQAATKKHRSQKKPLLQIIWGVLQVVLVVKNPPVNTSDIRDMRSIPGSGRSPGEGHGYPLQYACLENPTDRGAWWATVHRDCKELNMTEATENTHTNK